MASRSEESGTVGSTGFWYPCCIAQHERWSGEALVMVLSQSRGVRCGVCGVDWHRNKEAGGGEEELQTVISDSEEQECDIRGALR
jgi:hypothetical protein